MSQEDYFNYTKYSGSQFAVRSYGGRDYLWVKSTEPKGKWLFWCSHPRQQLTQPALYIPGADDGHEKLIQGLREGEADLLFHPALKSRGKGANLTPPKKKRKKRS